jgi:hypothetical protein
MAVDFKAAAGSCLVAEQAYSPVAESAPVDHVAQLARQAKKRGRHLIPVGSVRNLLAECHL